MNDILKIKQAKYGSSIKWIDVTELIRNMNMTDILKIDCGKIFSDPIPYVPKYLQILTDTGYKIMIYEIHGKFYDYDIIGENDIMKVISAKYGSAITYQDVTDRIKNQELSINKIMEWNCQDILGDPSTQNHKNLIMETETGTWVFKELHNRFQYYYLRKQPLTNNKYNIGLCISTYFNETTDPRRLEIFKQGISSLMSTKFDGIIYLIDDGSKCKDHLDWVKQKFPTRINIYEKPQNGGISKVKNTSLRLLLEQEVDILFLADDDLIYIDDSWHQYYLEAIEKIGYGHLCYRGNYNPNDDIIYKNKFPLINQKNGSGCLLIFTRDIVLKYGYFKVMKEKYGYEHPNYSYRICYDLNIPGLFDIINSSDIIACDSKISSLSEGERDRGNNNNVEELYAMDKVIECIE
jgi:hypothetical protein